MVLRVQSDEIEKARKAALGDAWEGSTLALSAAESISANAAIKAFEKENHWRSEIEALSSPRAALNEIAKNLMPQQATLSSLDMLIGASGITDVVDQTYARSLDAVKAAQAHALGGVDWTAAMSGLGVKSIADQVLGADAISAAKAFTLSSLSDMAEMSIANLRNQWQVAIGIRESFAHYDSITKVAAGVYVDQIEKACASFDMAAGYVSITDQHRQFMNALSGSVAASFDVAQFAGRAGLAEALNHSLAIQYAEQAEQITNRWREMLGSTPIFDAATTLRLAEIQGIEGLAKQFVALGLQPEDYLDSVPGNQGSDADHRALSSFPADLVTPRLGDLRQIIINLIATYLWLTLLSPFVSNPDMDAVNKRFDQVESLVKSLPELLEPLVERAVRKELGLNRASFVVRERIARLKADPVSGARVVAEIFPNQVLTLLEERGKWIRVEFYDYVAQDVKEGWVLKKYCQRITRQI